MSKSKATGPHPQAEIPFWAYTKEEGGQWHTLKSKPINRTFQQMILEECKNAKNWGGSYIGQVHTDHFTFVFNRKVHSLRFPDGSIWDSTLRRLIEE